MMINIKIFILTMVSLLLIINSKFKVITLFAPSILIFCVEFFFIIKLLLEIGYSIKTKKYLKIVFPSSLISPPTKWNFLKFWFDVNKAHAYKRVYIMLLKKPLNIKNIFFILLIWISALPIKMLKWVWLLLKNANLPIGEVIFNEYFKWKTDFFQTQIEIFKGKIYLNCFTTGKLAQSVKMLFPYNKALTLRNQTINDFWADIKISVIKFKTLSALNSIPTKLFMARIDPGSGQLTPPHPTFQQGPHTIHGTSNQVFELTNNQTASAAMLGLIKPKAPNPASITTAYVPKIMISKTGSTIYVPKYQIDTVMFHNKLLFDLTPQVFEENSLKRFEYSQKIQKHFGNELNEYFKNQIIEELEMGSYDSMLTILSNEEIAREIKIHNPHGGDIT